jgi:predicted double-glycine peptidase
MLLAALIGVYGGVLPVVSYAVRANTLAALENRYWDSGVCRQSTDYTCGPAAAVTALRMLGLHAREGELAQDCRTSPFGGTPGDILAECLQTRFSSAGLRAEWRRFENLNQLRQSGVTLVAVKYAPFIDHWIVVSSVTDTEVHFADPLSGWGTESHADFFKRWRHLGIALKK